MQFCLLKDASSTSEKEKEGQSIGYYTKQKQINKELFRRQVNTRLQYN
jgi:hypothetical protein